MNNTPDLEYINTGLFTRFVPNTPAGIAAWNVMAESQGGTAAVLVTQAPAVLAQLRKAGYSVRKAPKPAKITASEFDQLLTELGI